MKVIELDKSYAREFYRGNFRAMIQRRDGIIFDDERIRHAFSFGNGTESDMKRYMKDNSVYCRYFDLEKQCFIY